MEILNEVNDSIKNHTPLHLSIPSVNTNHLIEYYKREDIILTHSNFEVHYKCVIFDPLPDGSIPLKSESYRSSVGAIATYISRTK